MCVLRVEMPEFTISMIYFLRFAIFAFSKSSILARSNKTRANLTKSIHIKWFLAKIQEKAQSLIMLFAIKPNCRFRSIIITLNWKAELEIKIVHWWSSAYEKDLASQFVNVDVCDAHLHERIQFRKKNVNLSWKQRKMPCMMSRCCCCHH